MPGNVAPVANEREALIEFLRQQRLVMRLTAYGLTDDDARATPSASALSVGGLIKCRHGRTGLDRRRAATRFWFR